MKKYKILTGIVATAVLGGASAMAQFNYHNGDMIAAFGNGGSTDVIVDLGPITPFQYAGLAPFSYDLGFVLNLEFGGVSGNLYWSVFGVNDTSITPNNSSVAQTDANTIWTTQARSNPGIKSSTPHVGGSSIFQQNTLVDIQSIANDTDPNAANPGLIANYAPGIELVNTSVGTYSPMMTGAYNGNFQGDWTYDVLNDGAGVSDLYQSNPGNHNTQLASYLGAFTLSPAGILTFNAIPEPSTWAMFGSGILALFAIRRRSK